MGFPEAVQLTKKKHTITVILPLQPDNSNLEEKSVSEVEKKGKAKEDR